MRDEQQTDEQEAATPQGILADMVSRASLLAKAEEEENAATQADQRAAAFLQQAERWAQQAQRHRIRAQVLREAGEG